MTMLPWILKLTIDDLQQGVSQEKISRYVLLLLVVSALHGFFLFLMRSILIGMSRLVEFDLRNDFFRHLERLHPLFYDNHKTGDLMALATNDLNAVRMVLGPGIMYMINTSFSTIMILFYLITLDLKLTLYALLPFPLMSIIIYHLIRIVHPRFEAIQAQFAVITSRVQENLAGVRVIKAYTQEKSVIAHFAQLNKEYIRRSLSLIKIYGLMWPAMTFMFGIGIVIVLWLGGGRVITGEITLGSLAAFLSYLTMLVWPVIALGWVLNLYQRGDASMGRINKIMNQQPTIADNLDTVDVHRIEGEIEFHNLTFAYDQNSDPVLKDISLRITRGMTLAVVGRTGSGKSTLVNLIPRLYETKPGNLSIDGLDIQRIPLEVLRRQIGYVPQETFLFSATITENITTGEKNASDVMCWEAAYVAQIHEEIINFPDKYQTMLGERGINLSGGQKQRIAIARALIRQPDILILDNSLSHVDTQTEERILIELKDIMRSRTSVIVSDRISTIKHADLIIVLDDGRIVEQGQHDTLLEQNGIYAGLYQKQLLTEELINE